MLSCGGTILTKRVKLPACITTGERNWRGSGSETEDKTELRLGTQGKAGRGGGGVSSWPGALDPRAGAALGRVRWVPSGSARSRAITVGRSNTDAVSVLKCD